MAKDGDSRALPLPRDSPTSPPVYSSPHQAFLQPPSSTAALGHVMSGRNILVEYGRQARRPYTTHHAAKILHHGGMQVV